MSVVLRPLYQDPFAPVLYESDPLDVTEEQQNYIKEILRTASADSRFAQKAYASILLVLTAGKTALPEITSITPTTAKIGDASFDLIVSGTRFDAGAKIIWNGGEEVTQFISDTELRTTVNMDTATTAAVIPVSVQNSNGTMSNAKAFEILPSDPIALSTEQKKLNEDRKKEIETPVRRMLARTEVSKQAVATGEFPAKSVIQSTRTEEANKSAVTGVKK